MASRKERLEALKDERIELTGRVNEIDATIYHINIIEKDEAEIQKALWEDVRTYMGCSGTVLSNILAVHASELMRSEDNAWVDEGEFSGKCPSSQETGRVMNRLRDFALEEIHLIDVEK